MSSESQSMRHQRGAAFHEAGHVIVAHTLRLKVYRAEIAIGGDDAKGAADIQNDVEISRSDRLMILAAGMEAQELFEAPTHRGAGWGDYGDMISLLDDLEEPERRRLIDEAHQRAHDILVAQSDLVGRVASALVEKKLLGESELRAILMLPCQRCEAQ